MKVTGIIAEYNPFHSGHAYHIRQARSLTQADYIVVVMSGNFTQRGTPSLLDKYDRTRMALACGADLVLELPVRYACASAEAFASGAVSILNSLGCVDALCFGSEDGDISRLHEAASLLVRSDSSDEYRGRLLKAQKDGLSYPAARSRALADIYGSDSTLLTRPNNILGVEYCRALIRSESAIRPVTVKRQGSGYHDSALAPKGRFSSASAIRKALLTENLLTGSSSAENADTLRSIRQALPRKAWQILSQHIQEGTFVTEDDFSAQLHYRLLMLTQMSGEPLESFADVACDLADRIRKHLYAYTDWHHFCLLLKSRNLTYTRISRCLSHILLDIRQEALVSARRNGFPAYLRILGFSQNAAPLLAVIKEHARMPLLSKLADAPKVLPPALLPLLEEEIRASHIYQAAVSGKCRKPFLNEYQRQIVINS